MIPSDFDVSLVCQDDAASVFAARRADVWHFVLQGATLSQFHWPRYSVARALGTGGRSLPKWVRRLGIQCRGDELSITLQGRRYPLPATLLAQVREDLPLLEVATAAVAKAPGGFTVAGAVTSRDFPVVTEQRSLAEAIAFERALRGELDPKHFGAYSAFCSWRDFVRDDPARMDSIASSFGKDLAAWKQFELDGEAHWELLLRIQDYLWNERVCGPGIDASAQVVTDRLQRSFSRLSSIQCAQFVLMNGMHGAEPLLSLAAVAGGLEFDDYRNWHAQHSPPESEEVQRFRTDSAFIELLGVTD